MFAENKVIVERVSPNGNCNAIVESDGHSIYFYLFFPDLPEGQPKVRTCWIRNLSAAPSIEQVDEMKAGHAPMLPAPFCKHPRGAPELDANELDVVWFEEGDAAALLERGEILGVIPGWSGVKGFSGYARDCVAEHHLCWPMPATDVLPERIRRAKDYWALWDNEDFWTKYRDSRIGPIEAAIGKRETKYFAIDGGNWPPKAMLLYDLAEYWIFVTLGVSLRPQPSVEMYMENPKPARRIELAAAIDHSCPEQELLQFGSYISAQANYPWRFYQWIGEGHTIPCDSVPPSLDGKHFPAALLTGKLARIPQIDLPPFRGDPINILWILPITDSERTLAMNKSSAVLLEKLKESKTGFVHRKRAAVA